MRCICPVSVMDIQAWLKLSRGRKPNSGWNLCFSSIYSYPCKSLLRTTCIRQQTSGQWDAEMKHFVYGGDAGTENDISWGRCPKTRRQVTEKVGVIITILRHQRKATLKWFLNRFLKYAYWLGSIKKAFYCCFWRLFVLNSRNYVWRQNKKFEPSDLPGRPG